jgi:hypothetical protein
MCRVNPAERAKSLLRIENFGSTQRQDCRWARRSRPHGEAQDVPSESRRARQIPSKNRKFRFDPAAGLPPGTAQPPAWRGIAAAARIPRRPDCGNPPHSSPRQALRQARSAPAGAFPDPDAAVILVRLIWGVPEVPGIDLVPAEVVP